MIKQTLKGVQFFDIENSSTGPKEEKTENPALNIRPKGDSSRLPKKGFQIMRRERERFSHRITLCARDPLHCKFTFN